MFFQKKIENVHFRINVIFFEFTIFIQFECLAMNTEILFYKLIIFFSLCQRPYHVEYTSSRPITEVKQH